MNIYAQEGDKVICSTFDAGYKHEQQIAAKHLVVGKEYTIEQTVVDSWHTDVYLKEFPGVKFNSVFFEDV